MVKKSLFTSEAVTQLVSTCCPFRFASNDTSDTGSGLKVMLMNCVYRETRPQASVTRSVTTSVVFPPTVGAV